MMINFSSIASRSAIGRITRMPLRLIPSTAVVPVLQGPLRGSRWVAGSSDHGCWLGSYECEKQRELIRCIKPGMICYDIGANVGFYTLLFAKLVGSTGHVFAFEPLPENCSVIKRHLGLNAMKNVSLFECALSDSNGVSYFTRGDSNSTGRIASSGSFTVETFKLDSIASSHNLPMPDLIKLDVEGEELRVLQGAQKVLSYCPTMSIATHGPAVHAECLTWLCDRRYHIRGLKGSIESSDELVATPRVPDHGTCDIN